MHGHPDGYRTIVCELLERSSIESTLDIYLSPAFQRPAGQIGSEGGGSVGLALEPARKINVFAGFPLDVGVRDNRANTGQRHYPHRRSVPQPEKLSYPG